MRLGSIIKGVAGAALVTWAGMSAAASDFPSQPIRIIAGFPAGGFSDTMARSVGNELGRRLKTPVIVENRPGANGTIGVRALVNQAPNGYAIGLASTPFTINPSIRADLPYDSQKDIVPVALMSLAPNLLVANPRLGVNTVEELVKLARQKPGVLNFASVGVGSSPHLSSEMLVSAARIEATHVPYNGSGPALLDLIEGRVDFMFVNLPSALPHVESGKLKALAVAGETRSAVLPKVPTMIEAGIPDFVSVGWYGVIAPAGVPKDIVTRYNTEINQILQLPELQTLLKEQGAMASRMSAEEFAEFLRADAVRWAKAVKDSGMKVEGGEAKASK